MVEILMKSAKLVTLGLLKMKVFWNKSYSVKIFARDVKNKILSRVSNFVVDLVMPPNFDTLHKKCETADLVTFTGEILNGKLHFLCIE